MTVWIKAVCTQRLLKLATQPDDELENLSIKALIELKKELLA